jgi:hypothetical protein
LQKKNSLIVDRLKKNGAIIIGKTNTAELGVGGNPSISKRSLHAIGKPSKGFSLLLSFLSSEFASSKIFCSSICNTIAFKVELYFSILLR